MRLKGLAGYRSYAPGGEASENVAWFYRQPFEDAARVVNYIAFFDEFVDRRPRRRAPAAPAHAVGRPGVVEDSPPEV